MEIKANVEIACKIESVRYSNECIKEITLIPVLNSIGKGRIKPAYINQKIVKITMPTPPKIKMTLKEVCKELGKDIEIVE